MAILQSMILTGFTLILGVSGSAQEQAGREVLDSDGIRISMEQEGTPGTDPAERLQGVIAGWEKQLGPVQPGARPTLRSGRGGTFAGMTAQFSREKGVIHGFVTSDKSGAVCHVRAVVSPQLRSALPDALARCSRELTEAATNAPREAVPAEQAKPKTEKPMTPVAPEPGSSAQPSHPGNWQNVDDVYFRSSYSGGVGGMVVITFEPIVLFKDGTYFEIDDAALEDVDLVEERKAHPKHFGRWSKNANSYTLTGSGGKPASYELQQGSFFKAFPSEAGGMLQGEYKRVSGGGNSAMGGEVSIMTSTNLTFTAAGQFMRDSSMGALNSGAMSGTGVSAGSKKKMAAPGSYSLNRYTMLFRYPDGHSERRFFAYASKHSPARVDRDMIFIGSDPYTTE
jgi:hypothetical protein